MKKIDSFLLVFLGFFLGFQGLMVAKENIDAELLEKHREGAGSLALEQDEISADVMELIEGQTNPELIRLLAEIEVVTSEIIQKLEEADTSGATIAAQTEIVEKFFEAAEEKSKKKNKDGKGKGGTPKAMLDMMRRMMGKSPQSGKSPEGSSKKAGKKKGQNPGEGQSGDSDSKNVEIGDDGTREGRVTRRFEKKTGTSGELLPVEFRSIIDAYNSSSTLNQLPKK